MTHASRHGEQPHHVALQTSVEPQRVPHAQLFHMGVLHPGSNGPLHRHLHDVHESRSLHPLFQVLPRIEAFAPGLSDTQDRISPGGPEMIGADGTVVGDGLDSSLQCFNGAAGLQVQVTLVEIFIPIGNAAEHLSRVDKVKAVFPEGPFHRDVIHLKDTVGRDPCRLDGGQIGANDLGVGEKLCHLNGPNACSCADIEDSSGVVDGGEVEFVVQSQEPGMVGDILLVVVGVIVGAPVGAVAKSVISPTVFPSVA